MLAIRPDCNSVCQPPPSEASRFDALRRGKPIALFVCHSRKVLSLAKKQGWHTGAKYTNLRNIRHLDHVDMIDVDWKVYDFEKHLWAVRHNKPLLTIARDIEHVSVFDETLRQAERLSKHARFVVIVPKDPALGSSLSTEIPPQYIMGYSVPSRYGATRISTTHFQRPVHLLGGRPDVQRALACKMPVVSADCNRFTLDAAFGDYFDGQTFRPHPQGGYERCLVESLKNINRLWINYSPWEVHHARRSQR